MGRLRYATALLALLISCSPEPTELVDDSGTAPVIRDAAPNLLTVDSDTILVGVDRLPEDILEIRFPVSVSAHESVHGRPILSVSAWVTDDEGQQIGTTVDLRDDGTAGDTVAGDNRFGGVVAFSIQRVEVGVWHIRMAAVATNGARSSATLIPVRIVRNNRPPVLSNLVADTAVSSSSTEQLTTLTVKAVDPDGKKDLRKVYFDSYLPTGLPASGNPFQMFDDGEQFGLSGDMTAADSVYSIRIQFAGATPGYYRFEFRAVDRSSDTSNAIIHLLRVTP